MAFNIWRFTDGKPGHDSQSLGLCKAIEKLRSCVRFDISTNTFFDNCKDLLLSQYSPGNDLPDPNIIIGAGHGTHLSTLCARQARGGKIIILMKPSLPLSWFDICIVPKHDIDEDKGNVITSKGALNPVQFNNNKEPGSGLILLGGPSKHYQWDNELILSQITRIVNNSTDIHWTIADSPRTPEGTLSRITDLTNIDTLSFKETDSDTIREYIFKSSNIWVSKDSISMVYESLSSGAAVGLLDVKQKNNNRIADAINNLVQKKVLSSFEMWNNTNKLIPASSKFNEAERCATLLLERGVLD
jgi:uncharacterized protein